MTAQDDLALWHQPRHPFAYPLAHERLRVRLRLARGDERRPSVEWSDTQNWSGPDDRIAMRWVADDGLCAYWEADLTPYEGRTRYIFHLEDPQQPSASRWFGERGVTTVRPESGWPDGYFHWPYLHRERFVSTPAWVRDAIGYEIFPDRFARGNPPVAPQMASHWPGRPTSDAFWGGDLVGVIDSLDYIASLGANLIWLTPIFQSPSNHKYNIDDYERIDPTFGDDAIFQRLIAESRARGMRIVLDGVFNHSGLNFAPWRDVAQRGIASPYWGWFDVQGDLPDPRMRNYRTFGHTASMPRLMTANPEVQAYLIERAQRWTRMGVSGWRLDVADEVDPSFWRAFRREIRAVNRDAYLVGEIAYDASRWLEGDQFDGVMNYPLRHALLQFATAPGHEAPGAPHADQRLDGRGFLDAISRVRSWYPGWATTAALNPLSTHDVPRFLTAVGGDVARLRLGLTFLLTYEGIPLLYYGDEVGLEGGHDPDTRRPMPWEPERQNQTLLTDVRALTRLRREHAALRSSGFRPIATVDRRVAVYLRGVSGTEELPGEGGAPGEVALIALNSAPEPVTIDLSMADLTRPALPGALTWPTHATHARDLLTNARVAAVDDALRLSLPPLGAAILGPDV
ncbi:MAG TPA: alpha amylase N-terminal ig-like domain-containing protein [Ktedonobacterales bacterium]|nr:alpha amylase N-terminal ig-like domain-containing protein [Ktedonobacterales bacterium]